MAKDFLLKKEQTSWVFITASNEPRHMYDIVFNVNCLLHQGVSRDAIYIFADHPQKEFYLGQFNILDRIYNIEDIIAKVPEITGYSFSFFIVGGHGSKEGIQSKILIRPDDLIRIMRTQPGIEAGCLVLAQCYAGLFNYLDAGTKEPQIVIMGATSLHPSLSDRIDLDTPIKTNEGKLRNKWVANIFLMYLALWIKTPKDVDGDGKFSLMDAYKYAGVMANEALRSSKGEKLFELDEAKAKQLNLLRALVKRKDSATPEHGLEIQSTQKKINELLEILYLNQEPWILHSTFARKVTFWSN